MAWIVGILVLIMGLALFYSVVMRYIFNNPPIWSSDLVTWFTGISAFLAGGYVLSKHGHVKVEIFYDKFSAKTKSIINIITSSFMFVIVFILIWKGGEQVVYYYKLKAVASSGLNVYIWLKWLMVPIGAFLLGLQGIAHLINDVHVLIKGESLIEEEQKS